MKDNFRSKVLIGTAVITGSFILFWFGLNWLAKDIERKTAKAVERRGTLRSHVQALEMLAALKRIAPEIQLYKNQMQLLLPARDGLLDLPRWLESRARASGLTLHFSFQDVEAAASGEAPGHTGFTLDISGEYDNLEKFFGELEETSQRFVIGVDRFDINQADGIYRIILQGRAFFR